MARLYSSGETTEHSAGITYICLLANGNVKIGYSKSLYGRLKSVSMDHGGKVRPLATVRGGYTREQCLQHQFGEYRLPVAGEIFKPDPELLAFAASAGFCDESADDLGRFARWRYTVRGEHGPVYPGT
jgi:hypothetical protein